MKALGRLNCSERSVEKEMEGNDEFTPMNFDHMKSKFKEVTDSLIKNY